MATIIMAGEALVEVMRTERDLPLDRPGPLAGPFPSGAPAISASAAARLGARVAFIGSVGADAFGDCLVNRLQADGVDCRGLRRVPDRLTGIAFVSYRSDGGRSFVFHLPQSAAAEVFADQTPSAVWADARTVHIMGSSLATSAALRDTCYWLAERIHARGGTVSLDPNLRPELMPVERIRAVCEPVLSRARIVMPSGAELAALSGEEDPDRGARRLLERGVEVVALKCGAQGSVLYTQAGKRAIPAYTVTEIDPTGAGDCFDAALLVGLSEGWPLDKAALWANAVGALATTRLGPMEGAPWRREVLAFMAAQGRPLPD